MDLFWMSSVVLQHKKNPFCLETATGHAQWLIFRQVFFLWTNWVMGMKAGHRDFISNSPAVTQRSLPFEGHLWPQWNCFLMGFGLLLVNSDLQPLTYCDNNTCHHYADRLECGTHSLEWSTLQSWCGCCLTATSPGAETDIHLLYIYQTAS